MKLRSIVLVLIVLSLSLVQTACKRTASDVWEDCKTCGRQVGRGVKSLTGNSSVSRQVYSAEDFRGPYDNEFIPLRDQDIAARGREEGNYPQPSYTPGEEGSIIPGIDHFAAPTSELARIFKNIHFDTNDYVVRGVENRQTVEHIASYMQKHPGLYIFVEGHCDQRGPAAYNLALGAKRANAVRNLLIQQGIDGERVHTISYGKERLLAVEMDTESLQKNRRDEFKLYNR